MTPEPANSALKMKNRAAKPAVPAIRQLKKQDITLALKAGVSDFMASPLMSGCFGLFYAVFGLLFVWSLLGLGQFWLIVPAIVGFPLVAPFAAAGLYEMSRRRQAKAPFGWRDILAVMAAQRRREMGWMAFVTLFIFWVWVYQIRLWLAIILKDASFSDLDGFLNAVFLTTEGWVFLAIGTCVGAALTAALFSLTVLAMPLLLDRETDFVTAMLTSLRGVRENPIVMSLWGVIVCSALLAAMLPAFVGLVFVLPILGHSTWHLYWRAVGSA